MNLADARLKGLDSPELTANQRALLRCRLASEFIHIGQYENAREALGGLWRGVGARPAVTELDETAAAEVLLQSGSLTGWLGTSKRAEGAQDGAKDLISEARRVFEAHGQRAKVSEAEYELGMCYWRSGALDEARLILREAVGKLGDGETEQKAKILIRSTLVEISAGRYHDALMTLREAEPFFQTVNDALKGRWCGQMAIVLQFLGFIENRSDYLDRAILEYTAAIYHYEQAQHERYCGNNLNNLAFLLYKLGRYDEAHAHLDRAQRIFAALDDAGNMAQVRETRARVLLAEQQYVKAADVIKGALGILEKSGEQALLADALTVQATIEARLRHHHHSLPIFQRAVKIAESAGALESAGRAALSLIEEHGAARLSESEIYHAYCRADELLRHSQDAEVIARLRACALIMAQRLAFVKMDEKFSLPEAVKAYEAKFIAQALKDAKGSITHAAKRLGINYQKLVYLLETRHQNLLRARTPVKRRKRSILKKP